ncbi:MAG: glucose-6-phosphate dehydrogenase, partial [Hypericibacter sp.]
MPDSQPIRVSSATRVRERQSSGRLPKLADPCAMVIFGATGDLTNRLVMPALYNLARTQVLPENFALIGVARAEGTAESWRDHLYGLLKSYVGNAAREFHLDQIDEAAWKRLADRMFYVQGDLTQPELYEKLRGVLAEAEKSCGTRGNAIFYLATADRLFGTVVEQLGQAKLTDQSEGRFWRRVVIEKPFGHSLDSARELNARILRSLQENQIFRIDHFLGKDTVQSIMAFRFANGLFEPIWNRDHIDHVQISVAETVTVERRGAFYDATGALRDMVPNHLCQLLSLIAMEPPARYAANSVRSEKAEALAAITQYTPEEAILNSVRAQYGPGIVKDQAVTAYRASQDVNPKSTTPTYTAIKFGIDNWRWAGVPFYLRTGKALAKRKTEIAIKFKDAPIAMFRDTSLSGMGPNTLVLDIQPDEGITLHFNAKVPGPKMDLAGVGMDFKYKDYFEAAASTGYETLIYDCMIGDAMLFQRADGVEAGWSAVQP